MTKGSDHLAHYVCAVLAVLANLIYVAIFALGVFRILDFGSPI